MFCCVSIFETVLSSFVAGTHVDIQTRQAAFENVATIVVQTSNDSAGLRQAQMIVWLLLQQVRES